MECELIGAQNALVQQSRRDSRGLSNLDGWGIGVIEDGEVHCVRQAGPAFENEEFRREASRSADEPDVRRTEVLRRAIRDVEARVDILAESETRQPSSGATPELEDAVALNVLWLDEMELTGSRAGRSLWYVERTEPHVCEVHGVVHVSPPPNQPYRAVVVASERITDEEWTEMPDGSVFSIDRGARLLLRDRHQTRANRPPYAGEE